jgi:hypothetical protein
LVVIILIKKKIKKSEFGPLKKHAELTTGEVIKMLRELKGWTQEELAIIVDPL